MLFSDNCMTNVKPKQIFEIVVSTNTFHLILRLDLIPPYQVYHIFCLILGLSPKQLYNAGAKSMIVYLFVFPNFFVDKALLTVERNCVS